MIADHECAATRPVIVAYKSCSGFAVVKNQGHPASRLEYIVGENVGRARETANDDNRRAAEGVVDGIVVNVVVGNFAVGVVVVVKIDARVAVQPAVILRDIVTNQIASG